MNDELAMAAVAPSQKVRRILSLDGGGVRGIIEVAFLEALSDAVKAHFGRDTALHDVFHLIGGTSTGSLIATALALGLPISDVKEFYLDRAEVFFRRKRWWALGQTSLFDPDALEAEIREIIADVKLGDPDFKTYLAIVAKRLDTGSVWVFNNIPSAPFFEDPASAAYFGNKRFEVAQLLRAATSAPFYFEQTPIEIGPGQSATFVDGALSPYNNPCLALLKLARLKAFGLEWPTGSDRLQIVSIGSGRFRKTLEAEQAARLGPIRLSLHAMLGMTRDADAHALTMMQWLGQSLLPQRINSEIGDMAHDHLGPTPLFSFLRLDLPLEGATFTSLLGARDGDDVRKFQSMEDPTIIRPLYDATQRYIANGPDIGELLFGSEPKDRLP